MSLRQNINIMVDIGLGLIGTALAVVAVLFLGAAAFALRNTSYDRTQN